MKTWIKLHETSLEFLAVVDKIEDKVPVMSKCGTGTVNVPHACTILTESFLSLPEDTQAALRESFELDTPKSPVFLVPDSWRMPQIMKALGIFKSTGEAARNGWNKNIEEGFTLHFSKMKHSKRAFTTFRPV